MPASVPRSRRRSAGLKKRRRRGCRRTMKRLSLILRSRDRIEPVIRTQITPRATAADGAEPGITRPAAR